MKPTCAPQSGPFSIRVATLSLLASGAALGQLRTWTTTTPTGDSGNWSDTTKWSGGDVPDTAGESASFGGYGTNSGGAGDGNRTIALDGNYTIGTLTIVPRTTGFTSKTFALTGTNTLALNTGLVIGGGTSATIAPNLGIAADQTWTTQNETGAATVALNGLISGPGKITRTANGANTGTSIITFSGANTFTGGLTQNAALNVTRLGSSSVVSGGVIASGPLGTGTVTLNAGTLASNGGTARTLGNNIVIGGAVHLGNSGTTGALTFSDTGLTTPSTFSLGSAINNNVSFLRAGGTNLTFDQVIAESGGVGQSVNFASTSGIPTVTINRTKTATGNILSGGVGLILNNAAANPGSIIAVNGSVTATVANKFSSRSLNSDGASLIATDTTNYSAVAGKAVVYSNGRVSFTTDQTQAAVAALYSSDSQLRLGLGSGAANSTTTENYNQSAIGNGKAGLVSASTGTVTYNGTLTAGSDNTYRVGGGMGTLALGTALTGNNNLSVEGGGIVTSTVDNTYTGTTTIAAATTISGTAGALSGTSAVAVNNAVTLTLTNNTSAVNSNRIGDSVVVTLNNSNFALGGTSTTAANETVGGLTLNGGRNFLTVTQTPAANTVKTLQLGALTRNNNALAVFRGDSLGGTGTARNEIKTTSTLTLVGGNGTAGTTTISILPWARGGIGTGGATTLATYETNGFRALSATNEFVQANNDSTARIDQAIATAGGAANYNVRAIPNVANNATLVNTASSSVALNSLIIDNTGALPPPANQTNTFSLNSSTINVASGAVHIQQGVGQNLTIGSGTLAFGAAEGVITSNNNGFLTTISTTLTGSGGISLYAVNGGGIQIGGTNNISGGNGFVLGGTGYIGVDQDSRFGNAANAVTHAGGELRFFAGFTSTRGLTLLGNVGNNTLGNTTTSGTINWNGNITGAGVLRLVNNAATGGTVGFSLGGSSNYTGGTQIEGINVTGSSNSALGTGTVTLIGANNNAAALTLSGTAPTLGGLRGTDGTVTLNPAAAAATLTVGSNNDNTVFNGSILQSAGKTASFTKTGMGTLLLAGNSSYTGTTTVSGGVLNLLGTTASSAINVTTSAKLLLNTTTSISTSITVGNTGTMGGGGTALGATVIESGGRLAPGNSPGVTSFANLSMQTNSDFEFELIANSAANLGINYDGVNILAGGLLTLGSGVTSSLVFNSSGSSVDWANSFWSSNQSWRVIDVADNNYTNPLFSSLSITNDSLGQSLAAVRDGAGFDYSVSGGDIFLNYSAIPEPNVAALLGGLATLALFRRRRL